MDAYDALEPIDPRLMQTQEGRIAATKHDPLLFALYYMPHHVTLERGGVISMAEFHMDVIEYAKSWSIPKDKYPKNNRTCFVAPRGVGKSTWLFTILPVWAAAHGHQRFIAAFADKAEQAEDHLATFKREMDENKRLRADFPELTTPRRSTSRQDKITYNRHQIIMNNGFVFMARGIDSANLGMKVGVMRPSLLILDDVEKGEGNYSDARIKTRLRTITDDIFMLNEFADVCIVGTTTKIGSIIDQIRSVNELRATFDGDDDEFREALSGEQRWVVDEKIGLRYWPALLDQGKETERSLWPEKWTLEELQEQQHLRTFAKNMQCRPVNDDSQYWDDDDIEIEVLEEYGNTIITIDPAVTTKRNSDYTGICVMSRGTKEHDKKIYLRHIEGVKLGPDELKEHVKALIEEFNAKVVLVETNMGGDLWKQLFGGLPAKFRYNRVHEKKEIRAQASLDHYQRGRVKHVAHFPACEEQLKNFPAVLNDDMVDAIAAATNYFLGKPNAIKPSMTKHSWV